MKLLTFVLALVSFTAFAGDPTPSPRPDDSPDAVVSGTAKPTGKLKKNKKWKKANKPSPNNEVPPAPLPRQ